MRHLIVQSTMQSCFFSIQIDYPALKEILIVPPISVFSDEQAILIIFKFP